MLENHPVNFREAMPDELPLVLDLYNYYILNSTATFDDDIITMQELQARLSYPSKKYRTFLVTDASDQTIIGFCFLTQFRKKPAYDRTAEIGLYLTPGYTGKGTGQSMVKFLESYAKEHQIDVIIATISAENTNSLRLFEKMGYEQCAHYREIAIKFNRRLDLINYEKIL